MIQRSRDHGGVEPRCRDAAFSATSCTTSTAAALRCSFLPAALNVLFEVLGPEQQPDRAVVMAAIERSQIPVEFSAFHCIPVLTTRDTGSMDKHVVSQLAEIDEIDDGREPFRPVRHHFGITSFGITTWTARAVGDRIINEHDEADGAEELYLVQSGRATFELDDARVDAPAGTFLFARPGTKRTAYAEEPQTTIVVVGGTPGQAYEVDGWELWAPFDRLYREGRYEEAADGGRVVAEAHPEYAGLLYNVACCESLAGRTADAIEHLGLAIDASARFRSLAADDSDFRPIFGEPTFRALVAG